jgi:hypothetical protein
VRAAPLEEALQEAKVVGDNIAHDLRAPLTRNQVELMQIDTTACERLPGFRALGISPRSIEDELEAMLRHNKPRVLLR